jgi:hypothetical protein
MIISNRMSQQQDEIGNCSVKSCKTRIVSPLGHCTIAPRQAWSTTYILQHPHPIVIHMVPLNLPSEMIIDGPIFYHSDLDCYSSLLLFCPQVFEVVSTRSSQILVHSLPFHGGKVFVRKHHYLCSLMVNFAMPVSS